MADDKFNPDAAPHAGAPWATMIATLLTLFVFVGLAGGVYYFGSKLDSKSAVVSGEQQLSELRAAQKNQLETEGYDPATKTWRVPVDQAKQAWIASRIAPKK